MSLNDNYAIPLSKHTPVMTVASILEWLDLEIEYVRGNKQGEPEIIQTVLEGTALHLAVMKEQLEAYALQLLDKGAE